MLLHVKTKVTSLPDGRQQNQPGPPGLVVLPLLPALAELQLAAGQQAESHGQLPFELKLLLEAVVQGTLVVEAPHIVYITKHLWKNCIWVANIFT